MSDRKPEAGIKQGVAVETEEFLDKIYDWLEKNMSWATRNRWKWYYKIDESLVYINSSRLEALEPAKPRQACGGESEPETISFEVTRDGTDRLKRRLQGKKVLCVLNKHESWYLKILDRNLT